MKHLVSIASLLLAACATEPTDEVAELAQDVVLPPASEVDQLVLQYCGMTRGDITTYDGFSGKYQRLGLTAVDEPTRLEFAATVDDPNAEGTFKGTYKTGTGSTAAYAGNFAAIPDNPAIGAALALDFDDDLRYDKVYFVLALRRSFGVVRGLCLAGADRPFLLSRTYSSVVPFQ